MMNSFSGKYNYWVLILMLLGLIISLSFFLFFTLNAVAIYEGSLEKGDKLIRWYGFIFIVLTSAFFVYSIFRDLRRRSFNLSITDKEIILKNIFTGKENHIAIEKVKGFSTSDIHSRMSHFHVVIIYSNESTSYEFPQFMLRNFKELKKAFKTFGIKYLGHEPFFVTWYGTRTSKYL